MEPKVIIEQRNLRSGDAVQRIALVYLGADEHRVYAPPKATGDPLEWAAQISVHKLDGYGEVDVPEPNRSRVIEATFRALEQTKAEAVEPKPTPHIAKPKYVCRAMFKVPMARHLILPGIALNAARHVSTLA